MAFSERILGDGLAVTASTSPAAAERLMWELPLGVNPTPADCKFSSTGAWYGGRGEKWILGNHGNTLYNHYYPPNAADWDCMNMTQQMASTTARSLHPGGVMVLLCDGSVRFKGESID